MVENSPKWLHNLQVLHAKYKQYSAPSMFVAACDTLACRVLGVSCQPDFTKLYEEVIFHGRPLPRQVRKLIGDLDLAQHWGPLSSEIRVGLGWGF